ncbi:hypothetical protein ACQKKX_05185 [Neorhizobium sp. NPDC001467]|uniref:hypothetical protein n=1 Tax=Neorhizobium sp. NPDC001467 TaxID=3390595 RepID=UPI003D04AEEB
MAQSAPSSATRDAHPGASPSANPPQQSRGPDRSHFFFFLLLAGTAFFATMLLVEGNLFVQGWQLLLVLLVGRSDLADVASLLAGTA